MWQYNSTELMHVGILGMRWGRRKGSTSSGSKSNKPNFGETKQKHKQLEDEYKTARKSAKGFSEKRDLKKQAIEKENSIYNPDYKKQSIRNDSLQIGRSATYRINDRINAGERPDVARNKEHARAAIGKATAQVLIAGAPVAFSAAKAYVGKEASQRSKQKANKALTRIGTEKLVRVSGDVYQFVNK